MIPSRWWQELPEHIRAVYFHPDHNQITQIPLFVDLLEEFDFPGLPELSEDLNKGFAVLGELHAGAGWLPRTDEKYNFPIDYTTFSKLNRAHVLQKLQQNRPDPHWQDMLTELIEERRLGRLSGPFEAPSWWPTPTIGLDGEPLQPLDNDHIAVSFCFSVKQTRQGETLRRLSS